MPRGNAWIVHIVGVESVSYWSLVRCMGTTPASGRVSLQVEVTIQATLSVTSPELPVNIPQRLSCVAQSAEFSIFILSPGCFCFVVLRTHLADGMFALA